MVGFTGKETRGGDASVVTTYGEFVAQTAFRSWLPFAVLPTIFLIGRAAPKHLAFKGYGAAIGVYTIISAGMYLSGGDDE